jgi:hypothetical protein
MYDYQISAATGSGHREHLLAQAETARLVTASRSRDTTRPNRPRSTLSLWSRGRVATAR